MTESRKQKEINEKKKCKFCGKLFERPTKYSDSQWRRRQYCSRACGATKRVVSDSEIIGQYVKIKKSSTEIAEKFCLSGTHVLRILKSNNVNIRPANENKKLSSNKPETKEKIRLSSLGRRHSEASKDKLRVRVGSKNANWRNGLTISAQGYLMFTASTANGEHASKALHVVIAEWKYNRKVKPGEHVHHIDGNKKNNDPDNIVILSARQHALIHTKDREDGKFKSV